MKTTQNLGLKKPDPEDFYNVADFNYNADVIDAELAKRVINAGGAPSIQSGLDAEKPAPGTAGRLYVATDTQIIYRDTGTAWQKVGVVKWDDIEGKPAGFTPTAHKSTHAAGGSDPLTPADIGAVSKAGDTMTGTLVLPINGLKVGDNQLFVNNFDLILGAHDQTTRGNSGQSRALVKHVGSKLVINYAGDFTGGVDIQGPDPTVRGYKIYHAGNVGPGSGLNADLVDNIDFRILNGVLQYSVDGGGTWLDVVPVAKDFRSASIYNTYATPDVWYTVLDITGAGIVTKMAVEDSAYYGTTNLRLTIDGVVYEITDVSELKKLVGGTYNDNTLRNYFPFFRFTSSLKVEAKTSGGTSSSKWLKATVEYGLL